MQFLMLFLCFAAAVDSGSWRWSFCVQLQPVVVVGRQRSAGQLRVRAAVRLALARVTRPHDPQDERQSQRRRLRGHQAAHGRCRRGEQEKLVYTSVFFSLSLSLSPLLSSLLVKHWNSILWVFLLPCCVCECVSILHSFSLVIPFDSFLSFFLSFSFFLPLLFRCRLIRSSSPLLLLLLLSLISLQYLIALDNNPREHKLQPQGLWARPLQGKGGPWDGWCVCVCSPVTFGLAQQAMLHACTHTSHNLSFARNDWHEYPADSGLCCV